MSRSRSRRTAAVVADLLNKQSAEDYRDRRGSQRKSVQQQKKKQLEEQEQEEDDDDDDDEGDEEEEEEEEEEFRNPVQTKQRLKQEMWSTPSKSEDSEDSRKRRKMNLNAGVSAKEKNGREEDGEFDIWEEDPHDLRHEQTRVTGCFLVSPPYSTPPGFISETQAMDEQAAYLIHGSTGNHYNPHSKHTQPILVPSGLCSLSPQESLSSLRLRDAALSVTLSNLSHRTASLLSTLQSQVFTSILNYLSTCQSFPTCAGRWSYPSILQSQLWQIPTAMLDIGIDMDDHPLLLQQLAHCINADFPAPASAADAVTATTTGMQRKESNLTNAADGAENKASSSKSRRGHSKEVPTSLGASSSSLPISSSTHPLCFPVLLLPNHFTTLPFLLSHITLSLLSIYPLASPSTPSLRRHSTRHGSAWSQMNAMMMGKTERKRLGKAWVKAMKEWYDGWDKRNSRRLKRNTGKGEQTDEEDAYEMQEVERKVEEEEDEKAAAEEEGRADAEEDAGEEDDEEDHSMEGDPSLHDGELSSSSLVSYSRSSPQIVFLFEPLHLYPTSLFTSFISSLLNNSFLSCLPITLLFSFVLDIKPLVVKLPASMLNRLHVQRFALQDSQLLVEAMIDSLAVYSNFNATVSAAVAPSTPPVLSSPPSSSSASSSSPELSWLPPSSWSSSFSLVPSNFSSSTSLSFITSLSASPLLPFFLNSSDLSYLSSSLSSSHLSLSACTNLLSQFILSYFDSQQFSHLVSAFREGKEEECRTMIEEMKEEERLELIKIAGISPSSPRTAPVKTSTSSRVSRVKIAKGTSNNNSSAARHDSLAILNGMKAVVEQRAGYSFGCEFLLSSAEILLPPTSPLLTGSKREIAIQLLWHLEGDSASPSVSTAASSTSLASSVPSILTHSLSKSLVASIQSHRIPLLYRLVDAWLNLLNRYSSSGERTSASFIEQLLPSWTANLQKLRGMMENVITADSEDKASGPATTLPSKRVAVPDIKAKQASKTSSTLLLTKEDRHKLLLGAGQQVQSALAPVRELLLTTFKSILTATLAPLSSLPTHSLFFSHNPTHTVCSKFRISPAAAYSTAFNNASYYLLTDPSPCLSPSSSFSPSSSSSPSSSAVLDLTLPYPPLPSVPPTFTSEDEDICLVASIYQESGLRINLFDWFSTFVALATDGRGSNQREVVKEEDSIGSGGRGTGRGRERGGGRGGNVSGSSSRSLAGGVDGEGKILSGLSVMEQKQLQSHPHSYSTQTAGHGTAPRCHPQLV